MGQRFSHRWKPYKCRIHQNCPEVIEIIYPDEDVEELERVNVAEHEKTANVNNLTRNSYSEYNETNRINKYDNYDYNEIDRMKVKERHDMVSKDGILIEDTAYMNRHLHRSHSLYKHISSADGGDFQSSVSSVKDLAKQGGNLSLLNIQSSRPLGLPNLTEIDMGKGNDKQSSGGDNAFENDQWDRSIDKLLYTETKRTPLTDANITDFSSAGNYLGLTSDYLSINTEDYARRESINGSTDILHKDYLHLSCYDANEKHSSVTTLRDQGNELSTNMETIASSRRKYKSKSFLFINPIQKIDRPLSCHLQTSSPPTPPPAPPISHPDMNDMKIGDDKDSETLQCLRKSKSFKHIAGDSISTMSVNDGTLTPKLLNKENLMKSELQTMHTTLNTTTTTTTTTNCLNESVINSKDWERDSKLKIDTDNLFNIESDNLSLLSVQEPILRLTAYSPKWLNRCTSNLTLLRLQPNNTQSLKNNLQINQFSVDYIENKSPYEDKIIPECLKLLESRYLLKLQQKNCTSVSLSPFKVFTGGNITNRMNDTTKVNRHCITPEGQFEEGIISLISQPLHIYNYYFWIHYEPAIEKLFENPNDRRIESIGRRTDCYIQLTKYIRRNAKGFIQIMVNILAPTASALLKCCKLFDDKFPTFYASANLLLEYNDLIDLTNFRVFLPNLRKKLSTFSLLPTTDYLYSNIYNDFYDKNNCKPISNRHKLFYSTKSLRFKPFKQQLSHTTERILSRHRRQYYYSRQKGIPMNSNCQGEMIKFLPLSCTQSLDYYFTHQQQQLPLSNIY